MIPCNKLYKENNILNRILSKTITFSSSRLPSKSSDFKTYVNKTKTKITLFTHENK